MPDPKTYPKTHTIPLSQPEDSLLRRAIPLCAFWFLALGGMGLFFPYFGLYLRENIGLRGDQVGAVFAVLPLVGFVAEPFWGVVADRTGLRARIRRSGWSLFLVQGLLALVRGGSWRLG